MSSVTVGHDADRPHQRKCGFAEPILDDGMRTIAYAPVRRAVLGDHGLPLRSMTWPDAAGDSGPL
jgi:hypothetical protein